MSFEAISGVSFDSTEAIVYLLDMVDEKTVFIAFDTETTGLAASTEYVIEIAALKFDLQGNDLGSFSEMCRPPVPMPEAAFRVHRISDEMLANKPEISEILPQFVDFFEGEQNVLLAQNAIFDIGFINSEARRHDIQLPRNNVFDQIELTRKAFPGLPSYALERVCKKFNLIDLQTHRAMADAVLVKKLFLHCLKKWETVDDRFNIVNNLTHYSFGGPMIVRIDQGLVDVINMAMERGQNLEIVYSGGSHQGHPRPVIPFMIYNRDGVAFLSAKCLLSNATKQFRIDRIEECRPLKS